MSSRKTHTTKSRHRFVPRQTRKFQLRHNHPVDAHVAEILDFAKSQRREVTMIRDGVRLLWALQNNDFSVLYEIFPHLKQQVGLPVGGVDVDGDIKQIKSMLELVVTQQTTNGYLLKSAAPKPVPPVVEVKQAAVMSADAIADNFLSMFQ